jgi:hypothetical protein
MQITGRNIDIAKKYNRIRVGATLAVALVKGQGQALPLH